MNYEDLPDGALIANLTIDGPAATYKNHSQIIHIGKRHVLLPSKQYKEYHKIALPQLLEQWGDHAPMDYGVGIEMRVYLPTKRVGDHTNYMQAISDILQDAEVVDDDRWLCFGGEGHWLGFDKERPRVELVLKRLRHPCEKDAGDK